MSWGQSGLKGPNVDETLRSRTFAPRSSALVLLIGAGGGAGAGTDRRARPGRAETARRLTSMVRHHSSASTSHAGPTGPQTPALLTRRSIGPVSPTPVRLPGIVEGATGFRTAHCGGSFGATVTVSSFALAVDRSGLGGFGAGRVVELQRRTTHGEALLHGCVVF